jgi:hypothetical protein
MMRSAGLGKLRPQRLRPARALSSDSEAWFRRYGREFRRSSFMQDLSQWIEQAPKLRVRQAGDRGKEQIGDLAVLNELLAGQQAWQIRKKVEYLKKKRAAWEGVYKAACKHDTALTLASLEKSIAEVRHGFASPKPCCSSSGLHTFSQLLLDRSWGTPWTALIAH